MIAAAFIELIAVMSKRQAARLIGLSRASHYRRQQPPVFGPPSPRPSPANKLSDAERDRVLEVLRSEENCEQAPAQVWARLLDAGVYLCSIATMYRVLRSVGECRERRQQRTHPAKKKPELLAIRPNQVWSWDIERHEALSNRVVVKGHDHRCVAAHRLKLRAARTQGHGRGWQAALTKPGQVSTVRWPRVRRARREGVTTVNQHMNAPQDEPPAPNLTDMGWAAVRTRVERGTLRSVDVAGREATVKACGVAVAKPQGHSWAPNPSNGLRVNVVRQYGHPQFVAGCHRGDGHRD